MTDKHCKDVTEELFQQDDYHHQQHNLQKTLPELESLSTQQLRKKNRLRKMQKLSQTLDE